MSLNHTSETALITTSLRALSNYEENTIIRSNDNLAELFLPDERKIPLKNKNSREMIKNSIPAGMYEYVIARTKYFDNIFIDSLKNNIPQIVFLGAGYDTRPYRFKELIKNTQIFELDTKPTQDNKIKILQKNKVDINKNIKFVPIDFEKDDLIQTLSSNGFDKSQLTLFLWEGVTFYLSKNTVISMLKLLRNNSGKKSKICFDFQTLINGKTLINTELEDETIKFGIELTKIKTFIEENGYEIVEYITAKDMEKKFLTLEYGELFGKIIPIMNFLLIENR
ncbi:MAG: hypothetical protein A2086_06180 [Spirochaetes bacterium GWD1_27_9]|nr:MAG: hypothetical protein A2Z98_16835 [Spirochaetes bacterium GWB1_27_13]OHD27843.1 MAG: hypothetical protein A2Y34_15575 [Spirochaetes bacterium GWC1_27_15]OHD30855.1 MAG: hypothetical protein A2086_06180 [Spirochaetes bacterium GWD1_27_9]